LAKLYREEVSMIMSLSGKLYISTIADDAAELARKHGLGIEIAEYCTALNMDTGFSRSDARVRNEMRGVERFIFHAPFNELCPAAIDPLIVEIAKKRYAQAYGLMRGYGINKLIVHSGFVPMIYFEDWFIEKSVDFWREFLADKPDGFRLYLENVLESAPRVLADIAAAINDERFQLCLDIGHSAILESDIPITDWAKQMLPFLGHVHLHNNCGKRDTHNALGDGIIDVAAVIRAIMDSAPDVTFTIETSDGMSSIEWLKANVFL